MKKQKMIMMLPVLAVLPIALFSFTSPKLEENESRINQIAVVDEATAFDDGTGLVSAAIVRTTNLQTSSSSTIIAESKVSKSAIVELNSQDVDAVLKGFE